MNTHEHLSELIPQNPKPKSIFKVFFSVLPVAIVLFIASHYVSEHLLNNKRQDVYASTVDRLHIIAETKESLIQTYLSETQKISARILKSPLFQIFAEDIYNAENINQLAPSLQGQMPYMRELLNSYVQQNENLAAYLVNQKGQTFLATIGARPLSDDERAMALDTFTSGLSQFDTAHMAGDDLVMNMYQPIFKMHKAKGAQHDTSVGVLITTLKVQESLQKILTPLALSQGEKSYIFQHNEETPVWINVNEGNLERNKEQTQSPEIWEAYLSAKNNEHAVSSPTHLFATLEAIGTPFDILEIIPRTHADQQLTEYESYIQFTCWVIALMLLIIMLALWWHHLESKEHALFLQYQKMAERINAQRKLLANINDTVKEKITLKDLEGRYTYANPSFSSTFMLQPEEVIGLDDEHLYGNKMGTILTELDEEVFAKSTPLYTEESTSIDGSKHHLEISKTPLKDDSGRIQGIVTIMRDITELVEERAERERLQKNSVRAFARIMEQHDPYLVKHAKTVHKLALAIGESLSLQSQEIAVLDIVAQLWQIGKIFVPIDVLSKKNRTAEESIIYRTYIEKSAFILDTIDWDMPVVTTMYQMHERLDGSGYPNGIKGDKIIELAKILAICEKFAEQTNPRSHTDHLTPEAALQWLEDHHKQFEIRYTEKLKEILVDNPAIIMSA